MNSALQVWSETIDQYEIDLPDEPVGPDLAVDFPPPLLEITEAALDTAVEGLGSGTRAVVGLEAENQVVADLRNLAHYQPRPEWKELISA